MKQRSGFVLSLLTAGALTLALGFAATPAQALAITPAGTTCTTNDNSNFGESEVEALALACFGSTVDLDLGYKAEVGGGESGTFATSYQTTFSNSATDPADALIEFISGLAIDCPTCFLVVKDGRHTPAQYLFDLSSWNGTEDLVLTGFWPNGGAISNIAIWVGDGDTGQLVSEPGSLALLGLALLGFVASRRRR